MDLTVRIAGYTYVMEIKLRRDALPAGPADRSAPRLTASVSAVGARAADAMGVVASGTVVQDEAEKAVRVTQGECEGEGPGSLRASQNGGNPALAQIQARGYSAKYRGAPGKGLFEVGLVFGRAERNLVQADWRAVGA